MAKLPGVSEQLPVARSSTAVPSVSSLGSDLAQIGNMLGSEANNLYAAYEKEKAEINETRVEDAFTQLRNRQIELSVGEEEGFVNQKSGDAVNKPLLKDWTEKFDTSYEEIASKLENDEQRQAFKRRFDVSRSQYQMSILKHRLGEKQVYEKQVFNSTLEVEQKSSSLSWSSPGEVMASLARTKQAVNRYAKSNGIEGVALESMQNDAASAIHSTVINESLANGNSAYAKEWFKAHKPEIDEAQAIRLQKAITEGEIRGFSQEKADELIAKYDGETALSKAREIKDPEKRDAVVTRIKSRINEEKALESQKESDALDQAWGLIAEGGGRESIPPKVWSDMSGTGQRQVVDYLRVRAQKPNRSTDLPSYYEMKGLMGTDREKAKDYLFSNISRFSETDAKGFIDELMQSAQPPKDFITDLSAFNNIAEAIIGPKPSSSKRSTREAWTRRYNVLSGVFRERREEWFENNPGKKFMPPEERQKMLDELSIEAVRKNSLFGIDWLNPDETVGLDDIPLDDLEMIKEALEQQGQPLTAKNIMTYYLKGLE